MPPLLELFCAAGVWNFTIHSTQKATGAQQETAPKKNGRDLRSHFLSKSKDLVIVCYYVVQNFLDKMYAVFAHDVVFVHRVREIIHLLA